MTLAGILRMASMRLLAVAALAVARGAGGCRTSAT